MDKMDGLLPLVPLTKDGKQPEVIKKMIDRLVAADEIELLAMAEIIGGLVFKKGPELEAFRREFSMYRDILSDSAVYQEIGEEFFQKGLEEGIKKSHDEEVGRERQILVNFVQIRFPELASLAQQQADSINDPDGLYTLIQRLFAAQNDEEAKHILLEAGKQS